MALTDLVTVELLVLAFAGGAFGAAVGALPSFVLAGLMVVAGELLSILARGTGASVPDLTGGIAFGVVLGPHVAFGGGAAALAYAATRGYLNADSDFEYAPAKEVTRGLGTRPDVLVVGGVFGVVGFAVAALSAALALPTDSVALGVVGSALVHRVVFGYSLIGAPVGRLFDMTPFERARMDSVGGDEVFAEDGGVSTETTPRDATEAGPDVAPGGGLPVEPWLPYQYRWGGVCLLGLVVGVLGAYVAYLTGSAFLAFGISVISLVFLNAGVEGIPVTHHMSLPASTAVIAAVGGAGTPDAIAAALPLSEAILLGAGFGLLGAFLGEVAQRVLYAHADTHLDPPAVSIVLTSFVVACCALLGAFPDAAWVPLP